MDATPTLARPGSPGAYGAMLDEYARAARDFCDVLARFDGAPYVDERPAPDPWGVSPRAIALHVCRAAWGYSRSLRKALDLPRPEKLELQSELEAPGDARAELERALRDTELAVDPLREKAEKDVMAMTFAMPWGQLYDPEILLEHAIVHLLRHRRQLERW